MLVVIANNLPPAIRGRMKLWFIEAKANIFVSAVKDNVANEVVNYLISNCSVSSGLIIFKSLSKSPGYKIITLGSANKRITEISGLQLIIEKFII